MKRRWRILGLTLGVLALCYQRFPAPAVLAATALPLEQALACYPAGSSPVELVNEEGTRLRGVFVPADEGAPVVLHLLDASTSFGTEQLDLGELTTQLADLGCASLVVDYSGVGLSEGSRSSNHLPADARAAWREAVRRAGGPERVILRGISLGTLAAELLLDEGERPAAVVLVAPVLPASVVPRFGATLFGFPGRWVGSFFFRPVLAMDPFTVLARCGVPCTVILPENDELLSAEEDEQFRAVAEASGARAEFESEGHVLLSLGARRLFAGELEAYRALGQPDVERREAEVLQALPPEIAALFRAGSEARARLRRLMAVQCRSPAVQIAAAALRSEDALASVRWLWRARVRSCPDLDFETCCEVLSLRSPSGPLPIEILERASRFDDLSTLLGRASWGLGPEQIGRIVFRHGAGFSIRQAPAKAWYCLGEGFHLDLRFDADQLWQELLALGLAPADAEQAMARILLKASRIPDCLQESAEGRMRIEARNGDSWTEVVFAGEQAEERERVYSRSLQELRRFLERRELEAQGR